MKRIAALLLALTFPALALAQASKAAPTSPPTAITQNSTSDLLLKQVADLKDQVAQLQIENADLKVAILQSQAGPAFTEKQQAIQALVAAHPGMVWDQQQNKLTPSPAPAAPHPAAKK